MCPSRPSSPAEDRRGGNTPTTRSQSLPKAARVRKRREFVALQRGGQRLPTRHFLVVGSTDAQRPTRLGVTVTRKIGDAVARNRVKRAVREVFRRERGSLPGGLTFVVIARDGAAALPGREVARELAPVFAKFAEGVGQGATSAIP